MRQIKLYTLNSHSDYRLNNIMQKKSYFLKGNPKKKWFGNILKFTAPLLAIFFAQLALGVDYREAGLVVLFAIYGLLADYFKKLTIK